MLGCLRSVVSCGVGIIWNFWCLCRFGFCGVVSGNWWFGVSGFGFVWVSLLALVFWCGFLVWVCFGVVCLISFSVGACVWVCLG